MKKENYFYKLRKMKYNYKQKIQEMSEFDSDGVLYRDDVLFLKKRGEIEKDSSGNLIYNNKKYKFDSFSQNYRLIN